MAETFAITEGNHEVKVWLDGRRRPWVEGGHTKDGKLVPTYRIEDWWRVQVARFADGIVRMGWALGTKEEAYGIGAAMARCWEAGYAEPQEWVG